MTVQGGRLLCYACKDESCKMHVVARKTTKKDPNIQFKWSIDHRCSDFEHDHCLGVANPPVEMIAQDAHVESLVLRNGVSGSQLQAVLSDKWGDGISKVKATRVKNAVFATAQEKVDDSYSVINTWLFDYVTKNKGAKARLVVKSNEVIKKIDYGGSRSAFVPCSESQFVGFMLIPPYVKDLIPLVGRGVTMDGYAARTFRGITVGVMNGVHGKLIHSNKLVTLMYAWFSSETAANYEELCTFFLESTGPSEVKFTISDGTKGLENIQDWWPGAKHFACSKHVKTNLAAVKLGGSLTDDEKNAYNFMVEAPTDLQVKKQIAVFSNDKKRAYLEKYAPAITRFGKLQQKICTYGISTNNTSEQTASMHGANGY